MHQKLPLTSYERGGRRGPDSEILGLKTRNPEVQKFEKKEFPDPERHERVNPEIPRLKTPDPGVPIKVLSPSYDITRVFN